MTIIAETEREGIRQCGRPGLANCKAACTFALSHQPSEFLYVQTHFLFFFIFSVLKSHGPAPLRVGFYIDFYLAVKGVQ